MLSMFVFAFSCVLFVGVTAQPVGTIIFYAGESCFVISDRGYSFAHIVDFQETIPLPGGSFWMGEP